MHSHGRIVFEPGGREHFHRQGRLVNELRMPSRSGIPFSSHSPDAPDAGSSAHVELRVINCRRPKWHGMSGGRAKASFTKEGGHSCLPSQ